MENFWGACWSLDLAYFEHHFSISRCPTLLSTYFRWIHHYGGLFGCYP
jgi:hypothetical protein